jgi:hypothetical protein
MFLLFNHPHGCHPNLTTINSFDIFLFIEEFWLSLGFIKYHGHSSPGVKRPGREVDYSPSYSAEVNNGWSYTSTLPCVFMACAQLSIGTVLPFTFMIRSIANVKNSKFKIASAINELADVQWCDVQYLLMSDVMQWYSAWGVRKHLTGCVIF